MGNNDHSKIVGIDDVRIQTNIGYTISLKDVMYKEAYVNYFGNEN